MVVFRLKPKNYSDKFFMNSFEKQPQIETGPEKIKLPEINVKEERGATLLSVLLSQRTI